MYSLAFPDMFNGARVDIVEDKEATASNLKLLIGSWKNSLFGDPYFGTNVKRYIYEPNNTIIRDLIIDDLYVNIQQFMPQVHCNRSDITITRGIDAMYAHINCINIIDKQPNMYEIALTIDE